MPKRKRVVIKASEWGGEMLLNPASGKMCCLGFASLALGKTKSEIAEKHYPTSVDIDDFCRMPSFDLARLYSHVEEGSPTSLMGLLATTNDKMHDGLLSLDKALPILRQGFREAGLTLVYRADL